MAQYLNWRKLEHSEPCKYAYVSPPPMLEATAVNWENMRRLDVTADAVTLDDLFALANVKSEVVREAITQRALVRLPYAGLAVFLAQAESLYYRGDDDPCTLLKRADDLYEVDESLWTNTERILESTTAIVVVHNHQAKRGLEKLIDEYDPYANVLVMAGWKGLYDWLKGELDWILQRGW